MKENMKETKVETLSMKKSPISGINERGRTWRALYT
jgi:hypothetical protein